MNVALPFDLSDPLHHFVLEHPAELVPRVGLLVVSLVALEQSSLCLDHAAHVFQPLELGVLLQFVELSVTEDLLDAEPMCGVECQHFLQ